MSKHTSTVEQQPNSLRCVPRVDEGHAAKFMDTFFREQNAGGAFSEAITSSEIMRWPRADDWCGCRGDVDDCQHERAYMDLQAEIESGINRRIATALRAAFVEAANEALEVSARKVAE